MIGILHQTRRHEIHEGRRPAVALAQARRRTVRNHEDHLRFRQQRKTDAHGVNVAIGRLALGELDGCDAQGPDVCLISIATIKTTLPL